MLTLTPVQRRRVTGGRSPAAQQGANIPSAAASAWGSSPLHPTFSLRLVDELRRAGRPEENISSPR
eukprot:4763958-Prymnesium_polylepis.2